MEKEVIVKFIPNSEAVIREFKNLKNYLSDLQSSLQKSIGGGKVVEEARKTGREIERETKRTNKAISDDEKRLVLQLTEDKRRYAQSSKQTQDIIKMATKARIDFELREEKAAEREKIRGLKNLEQQSRQTAQNTQSVFGATLGGSFFGNLGSKAVSFFMSSFSQLPAQVMAVWDTITKLSEERKAALTGLQSVSLFKGVDTKEAENIAKNLRLVKAGIVDLSSAATATKNFLLFGFSVEQTRTLLEGLSDTMAFNKQQALSYSDALRGSSEGIKNFNSAMSDQGGLTKNVSVILKEQKISQDDFSNAQNRAAAITAYYNGLMGETIAFTGDAEKITNSYTGTVSGLDESYKKLQATMGDFITNSEAVRSSNIVLRDEIDELTNSLTNQDEQTKQNGANWLKTWAQIRVSTIGTIQIITGAMQTGFGFVRASLFGMLGIFARTVEASISAVLGSVAAIYNPIATAINGMSSLTGISIPALEWNQMGKVSNSLFAQGLEGTKGMMEGVKNISGGYNRIDLSLRNLDTELEFQQSQRNSKKDRPVWKDSPNSITAPVSSSGSSGGGTGRVRQAANTDNRNYKELAEFARSMGFTVTATTGGKHNVGSPHYSGIAVDIRTRDKTEQQIAEFIAAALDKGFRIVDERVRPAGQKVWSGPHLHAETNNRRESTFNPALGYGSVGLAYLRNLDEKRFTKERGYDPKDVQKFNEQQAKDAEKQRELDTAKAILLNAQAVYGKEAVRIPEAIDDIIKAAEEVKKWTRTRLVEETDPDKIPSFYGDTATRSGDGGGVSQIMPRDLSSYDSAVDSWQEKLRNAQRGGRTLTNFEEAQQQIVELEREVGGLTKAQKEQILATAQQADAWEKLYSTQEKFKDFFSNIFDNALDGNFKGVFDSMLSTAKGFLSKLATEFATSKIMNWLSGKGLFGGASPQQSAGGGILSSIKSLFGGGGSLTGGFSGGTNPANGIFNMLTGGGNPLSNPSIFLGGAGNSSAVNLGGGGSLLSKIPILGKLFGGGAKAGLGILTPDAVTGGAEQLLTGLSGSAAASAGGLSGLLGSMGAFMTNPWTIGIAGAAIGGYLLWRWLRGDQDLKKLKSASLSAFAINVKDNATLKSIKSIGEAYYGKGKAGSNADAVVKLEESRDILRNYAISTGQNPNKIDREKMGDQNWLGNQFSTPLQFGGFREFGGAVSKNKAYIVGEKRPELFVPNTDGTILPSINSASSGNPEQNRLLLTVMAQMQETIAALAARIDSIAPGDLIMANSGAVADSYERELQSNSDRTDKFMRLTGQGF